MATSYSRWLAGQPAVPPVELPPTVERCYAVLGLGDALRGAADALEGELTGTRAADLTADELRELKDAFGRLRRFRSSLDAELAAAERMVARVEGRPCRS